MAVFVHGYGPGEQIKFIRILNLEIFIINKLVGGWWKTENPVWGAESSSGILILR